ncbi:fibropellin-1-like isoform X2 [Ruditapes philippinarum]|uniref:fibropellin-1-like isoform X2 n=1 Tax=Ruditapes philippinarum TaxID=129788 RepID=UPI00295B1672|nr:fibropellin-1-like isoform X2 [Ruditapes philippinarum]
MLAVENTLAIFILLIHILHKVESTGDPPQFINPSGATSETVTEDADTSTYIFIVVAIDNEGNALTYSVHSQTPSSPSFTFDPASRKLYPPAGLDAETTTSFAIVFSVTDGTSTVNSPVLTVNIQDVNEHSPDFNQTSYTASIYDTASNGDVILTVFATDLDVTSSLTYSITGGDSTTFSIGSSSGAVSVATASNLNAASTPSYTLTVQVSDTSTTDTASVIITVLDDPCTPNPCQNSGACSRSGTSYTCACQTGWIGSTCSTDDPCTPNPCQNSGVCNQTGTSYTCTFQTGWIGTTCSTDDPCTPNPCQNSGVCNQSGTSYTCTCQTGWIGTTCSTDDPCLPNPCENSGNCSILGTSHQCQCTFDYFGENCTEKDNTDNDDGLSAGVIAAIIVPSVCVVGAVSAGVIIYHKHIIKKKEKEISRFDSSKLDHYKMNRNSVSPRDLSIYEKEN